MHKSARVEEHTGQTSEAEDKFYPFSKESMLLSFNMMMTRNKDPEENGVEQERAGSGDTEIEEDVGNHEKDDGGEFVIVTMKKTNISMLKSRGCKDGSSCPTCHGKGCTFNDLFVVAESRNVTLGELVGNHSLLLPQLIILVIILFSELG